MKKIILGVLVASALQTVFADETRVVAGGTYIVPDSSKHVPENAGKLMQTYNILFKSNLGSSSPSSTCETPASLACVYGLAPYVSGCPTTGSTPISNTKGAGSVIAIVDAYDNSSQFNDLTTYSAYYGLPAPVLGTNIYIVGGAGGSSCTRTDGHTSTQGWEDEHVLDLEMVHAMAPGATIYFVEATSGNNSDMLQAEDCATHLVQTYGADGKGIVSNSWGSDESSGETASDSTFQHNGIVYVFSSGDYSAPARYPSSSPYVISTGASSILRDASGNFIGESAWNTEPNSLPGSKSGTSGGPSLYESRPVFQSIVQKYVGTQRGTPDISFNGDPQTGVCVYTSFEGKQWIKDGGTSVAAPALSGILTSAGHTANSSQDMLAYLYGNAIKNYHTYWHDGLVGNNGYPAHGNYDFVTGLGTPRGYEGK